jgi:hypothetical protein
VQALGHLFVSLLLSEGRSIVDVAAQAGHAPSLSYDTYGHVLYDVEPTENRPAETLIDAARAAGVPTVFPPGERPTTEEAPESARYQAKHSSPLRDSNPGPPPYHSDSGVEPEGDDDPSSPPDPAADAE